MAASDEGWAAVHATHVGEQALETQSRMRKLGTKLDAAATAITEPTLEAATTEDLDKAEAIRERVRISGFTPEETAELIALGRRDDKVGQKITSTRRFRTCAPKKKR